MYIVTKTFLTIKKLNALPSYWNLLRREVFKTLGFFWSALLKRRLFNKNYDLDLLRSIQISRLQTDCHARLKPWLLPYVWGVKSRDRSSNTNPVNPSIAINAAGVNASLENAWAQKHGRRSYLISQNILVCQGCT